jgi:hypothetical protein
VLLLHHTAKSAKSQYRGSTDILASVDVAFEITKKTSEHETVLTLSCFKHRFLEEAGLTSTFVLQEGAFQVLESGIKSGSSVFVEKIKEAIVNHPGITQADIIKRVGLPETRGRKILKQGDGTEWFSTRGAGKTLRYFPRPG